MLSLVHEAPAQVSRSWRFNPGLARQSPIESGQIAEESLLFLWGRAGRDCGRGDPKERVAAPFSSHGVRPVSALRPPDCAGLLRSTGTAPTPLGRYNDPREGSSVDPTLPVPLGERCGYSVGSCPAFRETRPFRGRAPIDCRRRSGADARPPDRLGRERLWRCTAPLPVFP